MENVELNVLGLYANSNKIPKSSSTSSSQQFGVELAEVGASSDTPQTALSAKAIAESYATKQNRSAYADFSSSINIRKRKPGLSI
jgi:hypothetical protein